MPPSEQGLLTERELEVMHVFWNSGEITAQEARDRLEAAGRTLTYTTVANLCRTLVDKGFLERLGDSRPFSFRQTKSFHEVSTSLVLDIVQRLFQGSRKQLLLHVLEPQQLSTSKLKLLEQLLDDLQDAPTEGETR